MDLERDAELAGCTVERRRLAWGGFDTARVQCPDGWAAARLLVARAEWEAHQPTLDAAARALRRKTRELTALSIHAWVKKTLRFAPEPGEVFLSARALFAKGRVGDCDDHARIVYALARKLGLETRLAFLARKGASGPKHVWAEVRCPDWTALETTVDADFGEDPIAAALRLGALRRDLRVDSEYEVVHLTPTELRQVTAQQTALHKLGYDPGPIDGVRGPRTAHAIEEFQNDHQPEAGPVDGIVGPLTIGALVTALQHAGLGQVDAPDTPIVPVETRQWSAGDLELFRQFAERRMIPLRSMALVMLSESDIDPTRKNVRTLPDETKVVVAAGLIQWTRAAAPQFAGRIGDIAALPIATQIGMMDRYYARFTGKLTGGPEFVYLANFLPALVGHAHGHADELVREDGGGLLSRVLVAHHGVSPDKARAADQRAYLDNKGFDGGFSRTRPRKGAITLGDLALALDDATRGRAKKLGEFLARLGAEPEGPDPLVAGVVLLAGAAGALGLASWLS